MRFSVAFAASTSLVALAFSCADYKDAPSDPLPVLTGVGTGGTGGVGGMQTGGSGACEGSDAAIVETGAPDRILLRGRVLSPSQSYVGEVLINGTNIVCAGQSCSEEPGAANASIVETGGIILPGMIDTHNHIHFNIFDEDDWSPSMTYTNHDQWPNEERYGALVDTKQWLNNEAGSPVDVGCELLKYGELKGLIAGTTSIQGSPGAVNRPCYGSLARTIDQTHNDLPEDKIQTSTIFPTTESADGVCTNFADGDTDAYVIHIAEGVDATARAEFADLGTVTTTPDCLYDPKTTIVHGTALTPAELQIMADNGMSLSWSPRSNVFLYGGGTDLSQTTDIPTALGLGINVALSPDWSLGGSQNLLDELRFADQVDNTQWGDILSPQMLVEMVTIRAAEALGLEGTLGSIEVGRRADILVIDGDVSDPYGAVLAATPGLVTLVMVDGKVLYGDKHLEALAPADPGCETMTFCCAEKFLCVAEAGGDPADKLDQTFADIEAALTTELEAYDAMNLSEWDFAPLTPLVKCP